MRLAEEKKRLDDPNTQQRMGKYTDAQLLGYIKQASQDIGVAQKFKEHTHNPDSSAYISEGSTYRSQIIDNQFGGSPRAMNKFISQLGATNIGNLDMNELMKTGAFSSLVDLSRNKPQTFNQVTQEQYNDVFQLQREIKQALAPPTVAIPEPQALPRTTEQIIQPNRSSTAASEISPETERYFRRFHSSQDDILAHAPEWSRKSIEILIKQKYGSMVREGKIVEGEPVSLTSRDGDSFLVTPDGKGGYNIKDDTWECLERAVLGGQEIKAGKLENEARKPRYDITQWTDGPLSLANEKHPLYKQYMDWLRQDHEHASALSAPSAPASPGPQSSPGSIQNQLATTSDCSSIMQVINNSISSEPSNVLGRIKTDISPGLRATLNKLDFEGTSRRIVEYFSQIHGKSMSNAPDTQMPLSQRMDGTSSTLGTRVQPIDSQTGNLGTLQAGGAVPDISQRNSDVAQPQQISIKI